MARPGSMQLRAPRGIRLDAAALNGSCTIGIRAQTPRRFRECTTDSNHDLPIAPNRLDRNFAVERPNQVWLAGISAPQLAAYDIEGRSLRSSQHEPQGRAFWLALKNP